MSDATPHPLDFLFHPRSIALVGITTSNPTHWTRAFLEALLEFNYDGALYLVNPKGGDLLGKQVFRTLAEVPDRIDHVVGLVPAPAAPQLVVDAAAKGARSIHFCTAGFSETGEEEGIRLEQEVLRQAKQHNIRLIGPNGLGVYCPEARISFGVDFPKDTGTVGLISQSGGNGNSIIRQAALRGIRFSRAISIGNAADLDESDFLAYLAQDSQTQVIAIYLEGVKSGRRFLDALRLASRAKPVVLLKGGLTEGGARAVSGHTAALAGTRVAWESLFRQFNVIPVNALEELVDVLVALRMPPPAGRNVALLGAGGGASVLITDAFERHGLKVPTLPAEIVRRIRSYTSAAGNILRNPIDYSQSMGNPKTMGDTVRFVSEWPGIDFWVGFVRPGQSTRPGGMSVHALPVNDFARGEITMGKPVAIVQEMSLFPDDAREVYNNIRLCVSAGLPVFMSFPAAANAINLVMTYRENARRK